MRSSFAAYLILACGASAAAEPLQCCIGPIIKILGGTEWRVTSCSDGRSLIFATMNGNPVMPFVFTVLRDGETAEIISERIRSKENWAATLPELKEMTAAQAAAFDELQEMTAAQFDELVEATKHAAEER